eukprot:TRINITY_DN2090_c0_g1_i1.p1 TRINITY_DN2090_c0_g1~~TRINITY_DN2090_c0_g1_i1.p1  ORF type:complete len:645 (+),score=60.42 TRINITY_DN2090_c0_g1_i1:132-2066(+)
MSQFYCIEDRKSTRLNSSGQGISMRNVVGFIVLLFWGTQCRTFIVLMMDDQGYDDLGYHHDPTNKLLDTPNMDKIAQESVRFDNFYVTPLCATTRASLLTGRHHLRTGVWGVHGGMDFINLDEQTMGDIMQKNGYKTGHFGKWHSGQADGYFPWHRGFDVSYMTQLYTYYNNEVIVNGNKMQTWGWVEEWIADRINEFISERKQKQEDFFILWTPMSIHKGRVNFWENYEDFVAPEQYIQQYANAAPKDLAKVYAMISYFDYCLGKVLQRLDDLDIAKDTSLFFFSDNGPLLYGTDHAWGIPRKVRVPSEMMEEKGFLEENGVRSFLFVRQTGVFPANKQVTENVDVTDILPTMLDLAGKKWQSQAVFDGVSFKQLLEGNEEGWSHFNRSIYFQEVLKNSLGTNQVLSLDSSRKVQKDQQLLQFKWGGQWGKGFKDYSGVRWSNYKYTKGNVIDILNGNHQEHSKYQIQDKNLRNYFYESLENWWQSVLAEPGSFEKPVFLIGFQNAWESHIPLKAPIERSVGKIFVGDHAIQGFYDSGDHASYRIRVETEGSYEVKLMYSWGGYKGAVIKISFGTNSEIQKGKAQYVLHKIDYNGNMDMGTIQLSKTKQNQQQEMQILLLSRENQDGGKVFEWLSEVRLYRTG